MLINREIKFIYTKWKSLYSGLGAKTSLLSTKTNRIKRKCRFKSEAFIQFSYPVPPTGFFHSL